MSLRSHRLAGAAATVAALTALAAPAAGAATLPKGTERLSDEVKTTRWAYAISFNPVRSAPKAKAKRIAKLRLLNEAKVAELYVVLDRYKDSGGTEWLRIRVPGRPNGRVGWVTSESMGELHKTNLSLQLSKKKKQITLRRAGKIVMRAPVGIGKQGTPTPSGHYVIADRFTIPPGGVYGPRALGTTAYAPGLSDWPLGGVIGIHGTNQPQLVPGAPSHGCIRMHNDDVLRLYKIVKVGTPIHIV